MPLQRHATQKPDHSKEWASCESKLLAAPTHFLETPTPLPVARYRPVMSTPQPPLPNAEQPPPGPQYPSYPQQNYPHQPYPHPSAPPSAGGQIPSTGDPLVPPDFSGWFQRSSSLLRRNFVRLAILQVLPAAGFAVLFTFLADLYIGTFSRMSAQVAAARSAGGATPPPATDMSVASSPVILITQVVATTVGLFALAATYHVLIRDATDRPSSVGAALRFVASRALPLLGWGLLSVIVVRLGSQLFVPGLYLQVALMTPLVGVVVLERTDIRRCFALVHNGRFWATFGRAAIAGLLMGIYAVPVVIVAVLVGWLAGITAGAIVAAVLLIPAGAYLATAQVVMYAELRAHKDPGVTTSTLAAELDR